MQIAENLEGIINEFKKNLNPEGREASFDYCYNYFKNTKGEELTKDMEKSCLVLGFYLASWGMLRGSSFLLQKSIKHYKPTIEYLARGCQTTDWEIDVDNYNEKNIERIRQIYDGIKERLGVKKEIGMANYTSEKENKIPSVTLVTKVMLGVFGIIPAYDINFTKAFNQMYPKGSFIAVNKESLGCLKEFYTANKTVIDKQSETIFTKDFLTGKNTTIKYTKAKIIDMYGWLNGDMLFKQELPQKSLTVPDAPH